MRWFLSLDLCKCLGQKKIQNKLFNNNETVSFQSFQIWKEHFFTKYLYVCSFDIILKDLENVFHVGFHYFPCFQAVCCNLSRLCVVGSSSIFSKIFSSLPHLSKQVASLSSVGIIITKNLLQQQETFFFEMLIELKSDTKFSLHNRDDL